MSGPYRCPGCGGSGLCESGWDKDGLVEAYSECPYCKGSGYRFLKMAGHGIPPLKPGEDPYEPAPKGVNW